MIVSDRSLTSNQLEYLPDHSFANNKELELLHLRNNPLMSFGKMAFTNLPKLRKMYVRLMTAIKMDTTNCGLLRFVIILKISGTPSECYLFP